MTTLAEPLREPIQQFVTEPCGTKVIRGGCPSRRWRHVGEDDVCLLPEFSKHVAFEDIALEHPYISRETLFLDRLEVDAEDSPSSTDARGSHLKPRSGSRTTIKDEIALAQDMSPLIDLNQLVGGTRSVAFTLGFPEEMVVDLSHGISLCEVGLP